MASLSTCYLGVWLGWQILLNLVKLYGFQAILDLSYKAQDKVSLFLWNVVHMQNDKYLVLIKLFGDYYKFRCNDFSNSLAV